MIDAFISNVKTRGLAKSNRFQVNISFPQGLTNSYTPILTNLFCEVAGLPGYNLATEPHRMIGETREVPYEPMYEQVSLTFHMDSSFEIKDAFESWMSYIIDPVTKSHGYYFLYTSRISIIVENVNQSVPYVVTLFEAYPKSIQTIQLDNNNKDTMRFTVGLSYKYWRSNTAINYAKYTSTATFNQDSSSQGNSGYGR